MDRELRKALTHLMCIMGSSRGKSEILGLVQADIVSIVRDLCVIASYYNFERALDKKLVIILRAQRRKLLEVNRQLVIENTRLHQVLDKGDCQH